MRKGEKNKGFRRERTRGCACGSRISAALEAQCETQPVLTLMWHVFSLQLAVGSWKDMGLRCTKSSGSALSPWKSPPLLQHSWLSLLTAFLRGQKLRLGQVSSSLKARILGDWSYILYSSLKAAGYHEFSVYRSSSLTCVQPLEQKKDQGQRLQIWSGRSYARTEWWLGRCPPFPSSGLLLSTFQVSRTPCLNSLPADPREPKGCTFQLLWKHLSFLIRSRTDKPLSCEPIFMQRVDAMTLCPQAQHKALSRMELRLAFQLLNYKQKSNPNSPSVRRKPLLREEPVRSIQLSPLTASQPHEEFGLDSHIKPSIKAEEGDNQITYL